MQRIKMSVVESGEFVLSEKLTPMSHHEDQFAQYLGDCRP